MAPYQCPKQVLIWSLPTLAVLISLFWYRRRKPSLKSDPGGKLPLQPSQSLGDNISTDNSATCSKQAVAVNSETVGELLSAIEKARRDLETSQPIAEVNSVEEEESESVKIVTKEDSSVKDSEVSKQNTQKKQIACENSNNKIVDATAVSNQPIIEETLLNQKQITKTTSVNKVAEKSSVEEGLNKSNQIKSDKVCEIAKQKEQNNVSETRNTSVSVGKVAVNIDREVVVENCEKKSEASLLKVEDLKPIEEVFTSVDAQKQGTGVDLPQISETIDLDSSSGSSDDFIVETSNSKTEKVIDLTSSSESLAAANISDPPVEADKKDTAGEQKMALEIKQQEQHDEFSVDRKLDSLELQSNRETHDDGERDSANHSPAEIMLESPALRNFSDAHSEGSSDSGKGCSDVATPPAGGSSVSGDGEVTAGVFEFIIPQHLVGRLIGRHGAFLQEIRSTTHTNVFIKRHPDTAKLKICAIEGAQADIDSALSMIRHKFPLRRYPSLTLEKVTFVQVAPTCELAPEQFRLQLVEGVNNDVILSSLVSAGHMFLQQPTHPSFQQLAALNQVMNANYCYNDSPSLEVPVKDGVCAAPAPMGGWYRAQIVTVNDDEKTVDLRFLDYGGYISCEYTILKKMRYDFLLLPFQAVECYLANVTPVGGPNSVWSDEATLFVQNLIYGKILQAQIYDYTEDGMPMIYLYATCGNQVVLVNQELVASGYAEPVTPAAQEEEVKVEE